MKKFILLNSDIRDNAHAFMDEIGLDGKTCVSFGDSGGKSGRQRGLQHIWYDTVVNSGMGGKWEDTKENVISISKYRFALPIFQRDDELLGQVYQLFLTKYGNDRDKHREFIDNWVHTEKFSTSQMAEFLTDFQRHYMDRGIYLPDPDDHKLLEYKRG